MLHIGPTGLAITYTGNDNGLKYNVSPMILFCYILKQHSRDADCNQVVPRCLEQIEAARPGMSVRCKINRYRIADVEEDLVSIGVYLRTEILEAAEIIRPDKPCTKTIFPAVTVCVGYEIQVLIIMRQGGMPYVCCGIFNPERRSRQKPVIFFPRPAILRRDGSLSAGHIVPDFCRFFRRGVRPPV